MATRRDARKAVVGLLYAYDLGNDGIVKFIDDILEEDKIRNKQREFSRILFQGAIAHLGELDTIIQEHLKQWDYKSLGKVEKAILRLGAYEIVVESNEPAVVINEAVELAKELADEKAPQFVNGVLDAIAKAKEKTS